MDDTYFIHKEVEVDKVNTRDILSKAILGKRHYRKNDKQKQKTNNI